MTTAQLARVVEVTKPNDDRRSFKATCADGSISFVNGAFDVKEDETSDYLFCHRHSGDSCECAFRCRLVLLDERLKHGLLTLVGCALTNGEGFQIKSRFDGVLRLEKA